MRSFGDEWHSDQTSDVRMIEQIKSGMRRRVESGLPTAEESGGATKKAPITKTTAEPLTQRALPGMAPEIS